MTCLYYLHYQSIEEEEICRNKSKKCAKDLTIKIKPNQKNLKVSLKGILPHSGWIPTDDQKVTHIFMEAPPLFNLHCFFYPSLRAALFHANNLCPFPPDNLVLLHNEVCNCRSVDSLLIALLVTDLLTFFSPQSQIPIMYSRLDFIQGKLYKALVGL